MAKRIVGQTPTTASPVQPSATTREGVEVRRSAWCDIHTGSKEALIATGIAKDGQFPGDPGRGRTSASYSSDGTFRRTKRARRRQCRSCALARRSLP